MAASCWYVYVLQSQRFGRTYVGIALDVATRLRQHNGEQPGGAKSTRVGRPWSVMVVHGPFRTRARAQRIEYAIKQKRGSARLVATLPKLPRQSKRYSKKNEPPLRDEPNGVLKR